MATQTWGQRWSGDYWLHRAAVLELSLDPWTPAHPLTPSPAPDPSLSPYTLLLGLVVRVTGAGVGDVLSVAALANLVLLLVGLQVFVRRFSDAPLAPFWSLLATLFLWGIGPWRWSGYLNANSIGFGLPYPSTFAFAVMLFGLSALYGGLERPRPGRLAVLALSGAAVVLTHPFTGVAMVLAAAAVTVARLGSSPIRVVARLMAAAAAAAALALLWPYYPLLEVLDQAFLYDRAHGPLYHLVAVRTFLALPALAALAARLRADRRDPLVLTFALAGAMFMVGWVTDRDSLGRALPLAMLSAHIALGVWVAGPGTALWRGARQGRRAAVLGSGALLLMVGVAGSQAGLSRAVPRPLLPAGVADDARLRPLDEELRFLEETSREDVLLVRGRRPARVAPGLGAKVVAPGYIAPLLEDAEQRRSDVSRFFATTSARERRRIIERYGVSLVLLEGRSDDEAEALGSVVYRDGRFVLVSVDR
ncbi:MAG: hypothetical protein ACRD0N_07705 [Acidimicrobiales bacterium]